ncbi:MAG TPA: hypothetical protein VKB26_15285 [Candidatus Acidoferrales bacterium]|nr:hypothetical protein [Candidatus Acidoferrales bacterium]
MNSGIGLLLLAAFAVLAVATSKGLKSKVLSILIIIGFMAVGLGIGFLLGRWGDNNVIGAEIAVPLSELLGAVGGLGCWRRNKWREKREVLLAEASGQPKIESGR